MARLWRDDSGVSLRMPWRAEAVAPDDGADASDTAVLCRCIACAGGPQIEFFAPPTFGFAGNGKPIYSWDEAAVQLTRGGATWAFGLGQAVTVTYAYRATAPATMPADTAGFSVFTEAQINVTETVLRLWSDVANITFVRVGSGSSGAQAYSNSASMLFGNYSSGQDGASAFAYLPSPSAIGASQLAGDVWVNISLDGNRELGPGDFGPHVISHEIGHAIGLRHPSNYDGGSPTYAADAQYWQDARMFTVMSYFGSSNVGGSLNAFSAGPQLHDIAAVQRLYGANLNTRTGDTVYGFNSNTGLAHYTITPGGASPVFAIWDAGGVDTLDLSGYNSASEIDLRQEAFSGAGLGNGDTGVAVGNIAIARGVVIENAIGGGGDDVIIGNEAANRLTGNAGADSITGGFGVDTAVYAGASGAATFARAASGAWTVTSGSDGADTLSTVEYLQFSNRTLALRPAEGSIDGNGTSDILLRNADGAVAAWLVSGGVVSSAAVLAVSDLAFAAAGSGDFDGDGRFDVLWRNASSGLVAQWRLDGALVADSSVYGADPAWQIAGIGDFNGDFRDDVLWRSPGGLLAQWQMNGLATSAVGVFAASDTSWNVSQVADFNGDGRDDILWRNSSGLLALWQMDGFAVTSAGVFASSDPTWQIVGTGDFNGDLREDILWRSAGGVLAQWTMDGASVPGVGTFAVSDPNWQVSDIGDYNGDGRDDILWQGLDGTFALWTLNGFTVTTAAVIGNPGAGWTDFG